MPGRLMGNGAGPDQSGPSIGASDPASIRSMVGSPMAANGAAAPMPDGGQEPQAQAPSPMMGAVAPAAANQVAPPPPSIQELEKGLHQTVYLRNKFRDLLGAGKPVTRKQIVDLSSDLLQKGILSAQRLASELASLPEDQDGIMKWLEAHFQTTDKQVGQLSGMLHMAEMPQGQPGAMQ